MKMSGLPPHDHNTDPTSSTMHHTVQAACMQVMSLTSHILAHGIAVTDRPSGGATNIVVGKGSVNELYIGRLSERKESSCKEKLEQLEYQLN